MNASKQEHKRKCPVCKGRARWTTCSENHVGSSECPACEGTGWLGNSQDKNRGGSRARKPSRVSSGDWVDEATAALKHANRARRKCNPNTMAYAVICGTISRLKEIIETERRESSSTVRINDGANQN